MNEVACGNVSKKPINRIAHQCAMEVFEAAQLVAVCLAPDGAVTVESADECVDDDCVGCYDAKLPLLVLWRQIDTDLRESATARGIKTKNTKAAA